MSTAQFLTVAVVGLVCNLLVLWLGIRLGRLRERRHQRSRSLAEFEQFDADASRALRGRCSHEECGNPRTTESSSLFCDEHATAGVHPYMLTPDERYDAGFCAVEYCGHGPVPGSLRCQHHTDEATAGEAVPDHVAFTPDERYGIARRVLDRHARAAQYMQPRDPDQCATPYCPRKRELGNAQNKCRYHLAPEPLRTPREPYPPEDVATLRDAFTRNPKTAEFSVEYPTDFDDRRPPHVRHRQAGGSAPAETEWEPDPHLLGPRDALAERLVQDARDRAARSLRDHQQDVQARRGGLYVRDGEITAIHPGSPTPPAQEVEAHNMRITRLDAHGNPVQPQPTAWDPLGLGIPHPTSIEAEAERQNAPSSGSLPEVRHMYAPPPPDPRWKHVQPSTIDTPENPETPGQANPPPTTPNTDPTP